MYYKARKTGSITMNAKHFRQYLVMLNLDAVSCASLLDVNPRTVRRWIANGPPDGVAAELEAKTGKSPNPVIDPFIIGSGLTNGEGAERLYLVHTQYPRFACVVSKDFYKPVNEMAFAHGNRYFNYFVMTDGASSGEVLDLLEEASLLMDELNIAIY
jgi:hypothetical protein